MVRHSSSGHDHSSLGVRVLNGSGSHSDCTSQSDRNSQSLGSRSDFRVGNCDDSIKTHALEKVRWSIIPGQVVVKYVAVLVTQ